MIKKYCLAIIMLCFSSIAFAAGECSNSKAYDNLCASLPIVPSYRCVLDHKDQMEKQCIQKAEDIITQCSSGELNQCATPENDNGNLFELCLAKFETSCGGVGKKYS